MSGEIGSQRGGDSEAEIGSADDANGGLGEPSRDSLGGGPENLSGSRIPAPVADDPARTLCALVPDSHDGQRFDQALAAVFSQYSRSRLQQWIRDESATVDGQVRRPRDAVFAQQVLTIVLPGETPLGADQLGPQPENIPLDVVFEDPSMLIINKPAGLVVHPGAGNPAGTLVNALLHFDATLAGLPRAGIVHRLDKDTTGLMVVARTLPAHTALTAMITAREVRREYLGVVWGATDGRRPGRCADWPTS